MMMIFTINAGLKSFAKTRCKIIAVRVTRSSFLEPRNYEYKAFEKLHGARCRRTTKI